MRKDDIIPWHDLLNKSLVILYIDENGNTTEVPSKVENGFIYI